MYTQDLASNAYAIQQQTGKMLWTMKYNSPDIGANGVTVANGTVRDIRIRPVGRYGMLKYTHSSIKTAPGKVEILFTDRSPLQHDVVLVNSKNKIVGQTPVFSGGSKDFMVTLTAGKDTYYCAVPGHREAGPQGMLTVTCHTAR